MNMIYTKSWLQLLGHDGPCVMTWVANDKC